MFRRRNTEPDSDASAEAQLDSTSAELDPSAEYGTEYGAESVSATVDDPATPYPDELEPETPFAPPTPRKAVRRSPFTVQSGILALVIGLGTVGVALFLRNLGLLPPEVATYYPFAVIAPGLLWSLIAVIRRDGPALLAGMAIVGVGISLLLSTVTNIPLSATLVGIVLISCGTGILLRGLIFGRQPLA